MPTIRLPSLPSHPAPGGKRDYTTRVDRRLIGLVLMLLASLMVAILAKALGVGHDGRLLLSAAVLGPLAAVVAIYALRLNSSEPPPVIVITSASVRMTTTAETTVQSPGPDSDEVEASHRPRSTS